MIALLQCAVTRSVSQPVPWTVRQDRLDVGQSRATKQSPSLRGDCSPGTPALAGGAREHRRVRTRACARCRQRHAKVLSVCNRARADII
jgi:hypothetical protein